MEPVIALHAPAATSVVAATATSSSAAQQTAFPTGATFAVVAPHTSPSTTAENASQHAAVTRVMSPFPDSLKFLQIASSTDSTCSAAVSTPESKSSDCPPSPKQVDFEPSTCSAPQSSSGSEGPCSYIDVHHSGGEGTDGEEIPEENLLPAPLQEGEIPTAPGTQQPHSDSVIVRLISAVPPLVATPAELLSAPVAALQVAAATAAAPLRTEPRTGGHAELGDAIKVGQAVCVAEPATLAIASPAEEAGRASISAGEGVELVGQREVDVAIIGAGLAGMTAALAIHKKTGRAVHVFEKEAWCAEEPALLRREAVRWKTKSTTGSNWAQTSGQTLPTPVGSTGAGEGTNEHYLEGKNPGILDCTEVACVRKEVDDREILLQANGLGALRCIDEQVACDVLENGHIVYSDTLDVFDWEMTATASATFVFGIYWSDLRQILYRHCQQYKEGIKFVFGKELKIAVDDSCTSPTPESASATAMAGSAASPSSPPTVSTSLSSPLSSSTISTPSSCSAYSSSLPNTPVGPTTTDFNHTKNLEKRKAQRNDQYLQAALSRTIAPGKGKSEKTQSFHATVRDTSVLSNRIKLSFRDGTQVSAKLVVGADGPESCARKTCAMDLAHPRKVEEAAPELSPSGLQSAKLQYQGLTELAMGEEELLQDMCLYHKKSGHLVCMIRALGPNVLTWSITRHTNQAGATEEVALESSEENDLKGYVLKAVAHMKEDTSEKARRAFEVLHRLIEKTSQEDVHCLSLSPPAYQDCRWTRLNERVVLVGNATIEDTVQLAFCLRDWNANDVWATQRFASIRRQSLSGVVKRSEGYRYLELGEVYRIGWNRVLLMPAAVYRAIWSNEELRMHSDGELQEMRMGAETSPSLFQRGNFVPVRSFFGADESQALMENAELETEYM